MNDSPKPYFTSSRVDRSFVRSFVRSSSGAEGSLLTFIKCAVKVLSKLNRIQ